MASAPAVQRVMAASVRIADRAAEIIRGILRAGDLGIVQKTVRRADCCAVWRDACRCIVYERVASSREVMPHALVLPSPACTLNRY